MAGALERQLEQPGTYDDLSFTERMGLLVERENRKQQRLVREARFRLRADLCDIDYSHPRNLSKSLIAQLAEGEWLEKGRNLLITGPRGCGKTWIACALGHNACLRGIKVRYYRISRLFLSLAHAKADGSYGKLLGQIAKTGLVIIDALGTLLALFLFTLGLVRPDCFVIYIRLDLACTGLFYSRRNFE